MSNSGRLLQGLDFKGKFDLLIEKGLWTFEGSHSQRQRFNYVSLWGLCLPDSPCGPQRCRRTWALVLKLLLDQDMYGLTGVGIWTVTITLSFALTDQIWYICKVCRRRSGAGVCIWAFCSALCWRCGTGIFLFGRIPAGTRCHGCEDEWGVETARMWYQWAIESDGGACLHYWGEIRGAEPHLNSHVGIVTCNFANLAFG